MRGEKKRITLGRIAVYEAMHRGQMYRRMAFEPEIEAAVMRDRLEKVASGKAKLRPAKQLAALASEHHYMGQINLHDAFDFTESGKTKFSRKAEQLKAQLEKELQEISAEAEALIFDNTKEDVTTKLKLFKERMSKTCMTHRAYRKGIEKCIKARLEREREQGR